MAPMSYAAIHGVHRSRTRLDLEEVFSCHSHHDSHHGGNSRISVRSHGHAPIVLEPQREEDDRVGEERPSVSAASWSEVMARNGVQHGEEDRENSVPRWFSVTMGVLIALNSVLLGIDTDVNTDDASLSAKVTFLLLESWFTVIWIVEMFYRIRYMGRSYFTNSWTLLDFLLVQISIVSAVEPFITGFGSDDGASGEEPSWLRFVRLARVLRLLRLVKLARMFPELWQIINGFIQALRTLGWVLLMLFLVIYTGGIFMTIIVGHDCGGTWRDWDMCEELFGTVYKTMYTLFQVMTFESWSMVVARPVIYEKWWLVVFFMSFLMLTSFGLLNIIVGVVVENTLAAANEKKMEEEAEKERKMREELMTLKTIFEEADKDGSGSMDIEEFTMIMNLPDVKQKCKSLQLPVEYPERLFETIDEDESGEITIVEFIEGAMMLKEAPSNVDMRTALMQIQQLVQKVGRLEGFTSIVAQELTGGPVTPMSFIRAVSSGKVKKLARQESPLSRSAAPTPAAPGTPPSPKKPPNVTANANAGRATSAASIGFGDLDAGACEASDGLDDFDVASQDETYQVPVFRGGHDSPLSRGGGASKSSRTPRPSRELGSAAAGAAERASAPAGGGASKPGSRKSWPAEQACSCSARVHKLEDSVGQCLSRLQQVQQAVTSLSVQLAASGNALAVSDEARSMPAVSKPASLAKQGVTSKKPAPTLGPFGVSLDVLRCTIDVQKQMLGHSEELLRRLSQPSGSGDLRQGNQASLRQAGIAPSSMGLPVPNGAILEAPMAQPSALCAPSAAAPESAAMDYRFLVEGDNG